MGIDLNSLGPYPLLQIVGAIIVLGGGVLAIWRGLKDSRKPGAGNGGTQVYLDGPLAGVLQNLESIAESLKLTPDIRKTISEAKSQLFDEIDKVERRLVSDQKDLDARVRKVEQGLAALAAGRRTR